MAGVENNSTSTPAPPVDSDPVDAGPSEIVTSGTAGRTPQGSLDQPAPLRCSTQKNPEPAPMEVLEFWFVSRYQATQHLGCMGWSSCHIKTIQCFLGKYSVNTLYYYHQMSVKCHPFLHSGEFPQ